MPIFNIILYACGILALGLPYLVYVMDGSILNYIITLLMLLAAIWIILKRRKPEQQKVHLSNPLNIESFLPPKSQQLANDIISTYIGVIYDKARFMSDFEMEKDVESVFSNGLSTLEKYNLTLEEKHLEQLRVALVKAAQQGLKDKKKA